MTDATLGVQQATSKGRITVLGHAKVRTIYREDLTLPFIK